MHGVVTRSAAVSLLALAAACGSKPTPKPPPQELEITGPASFAGTWVADDDMSFGYRLTITTDGQYMLVIDRGKLSRCETKGTLVAGSDPRSYTIPQAQHTCDAPATTIALDVTIRSFTGANLVVETSGSGTGRTYTRAPDNTAE